MDYSGLEQLPGASSFATMVTALTLLGLPEGGPSFQFRCHVTSHGPGGAVLLEQTTQTRTNPDWLVKFLHVGPGLLTVGVEFRPTPDAEWRELGDVSTCPASVLGDERGAQAELAIKACRFAPDLRVTLQFSKAEAQPAVAARTASASVFARTLRRPAPSIGMMPPEQAQKREAAEADALSAVADVPELTTVEQIIVKDTWNKLLAFHEMLVEMFFERLLHEQPELVEAFGDAIDNVADDFACLIDMAVRELLPHTENVLRESYRNVPGMPKPECDSVREFVTLFTDLGMRPRHWLSARKVWIWMLNEIPYLEEYERDNLRHGQGSAAFKFFTRHIVAPALEAHASYEQALTPDMVAEMARCGAFLARDAKAIGIEFYQLMFKRSPEVIGYFGRTDMDHLADHLFKSISFLTQTLESGDNALGSLRHLAAVHTEFMVPPEAYDALTPPMMEVMRKHYPAFDDRLEHAWKVLLQRVVHILAQPMINRRRLVAEARKWLDLIAGEQEWPVEDKDRRWGEIVREVNATGTYTHTYEELAYGAQVAWRNAPKCIARISWRNMIVRDVRHVTDPDEMFRECVEHVRMGVNGGNMQIVMNVFRPKRPKERWGPRIWNPQYLRYAGYEQADDTVMGDKANVRLTKAIEKLGWKAPATPTRFDLLPLVIDTPGQPPKIYEFGPDDRMEVSIEHPTVPGFTELGLKWVVIPAIANFRMDIGGIHYGCIPFNGWFMETEIARNLWEANRYDQAEKIARVLGLDTSSEQTLWRDRAFLELNVAVLHSFSKAKVSLVDHQTASKQFMAHDLREKKAGRECPAQWSWVVPSTGGSSTPVWHHEMRDFYLSPHYHYTADKWAVLGDEIDELAEGPGEEAAASTLLILYGSETGTSEGMARQAARRLQLHRPKVMALDDCEPLSLADEAFVLVITSTFGEGDLPGNAKRFGKKLKELSRGALTGLNYAILALGSTVYPHFCAAGATLDRELSRLGGIRAVAMHRGDEIKGQAATFQEWLGVVARLLGEDPTAATAAAPKLQVTFLAGPGHDAPAAERPGFRARVVANRELLKEIIPGSRSTRFIALDLAGLGMSYETGDHLSVHPQNSPEAVDRLCAKLCIDPESWIATGLVDASGAAVDGETDYPQPVRLRQVLSEDLDLSLREPVTGLLRVMAETAGSAGEKAKLGQWVEELSVAGDTPERAALSQEIVDTYLTVLDLFDAFPSCQVGLEALLELLPRLKPRLYSISSSSLSHPEQVQVTIGVVQVKTAEGRVRQGVCSNFLASLDPERGDTARVVIRTSTFRPPADLHTPMLMVGPGTGLSPLIGFLQHRGAQMKRMEAAGMEADLGDARLYFGCRDTNDYLYQDDLEAWRDRGLISRLAVAFSRASEKRTYVQHLIAEHGPEIWQVLQAPRCHYYICGDAKMADDVFDALMAIAQKEGGLTRGQAIDFFDRMKAEKRFHADVWGITLNFRQALSEVREAKYNQGERWLRQVSAAELPGEKAADQAISAEGTLVSPA